MLLPPTVQDFIAFDAAVRVIDAFVTSLDLHSLGFERARPATLTAAPATSLAPCCGSISTATSTSCARRGDWKKPVGSTWS
jgi:hypothetical protein